MRRRRVSSGDSGDGGYDELIVATGIPFHSLCEHHLLPFVGVAHVGHLPGERIVGLSKLALCMSLRGVVKPGARTVTSALRGRLRDDSRPGRSSCRHTGRRRA